ncbi:MAG: thiamine phosphate synthase [Gemmatimonadetes bacterium]|nr:thiamine phosphate synthase [Gemmatimonadota bacterium]
MAGDRFAGRIGLIAITDPDCAGRSVVEVVRSALRGGAGAVQLRSKDQATRDMVELGTALKVETVSAGALLFVNDRVDVALVIGADGAHLGDDDLPLEAARAIVPPGFLLGRSVDTADEARVAEKQGADYLGAGPLRATPSKLDAAPAIGLPGIRAIAAVTALPVVAIGGVDHTNAGDAAAAGAAGVAVIRAIMQADDPEEAARALLAEVRKGRVGAI